MFYRKHELQRLLRRTSPTSITRAAALVKVMFYKLQHVKAAETAAENKPPSILQPGNILNFRFASDALTLHLPPPLQC